MANQLHLEASLFRGHRLQVEVLRALDLDFILTELILQLFCEGVGEISGLLTIDQPRAVLTDLTLDDVYNHIEGLELIRRDLLSTDDTVLYRDGHLDLILVFLSGESDVADGVFLEELR